MTDSLLKFLDATALRMQSGGWAARVARSVN
jgi:hypothetical protein